MEQIIITISPEAETTVEVVGCNGSNCQALTKGIEQAIGETRKDVKKPEFFITAKENAHVRR